MSSAAVGRSDPQLSLRQLRQFLAVAEEGNMRRAAERLFLSQPGLSLSIQQLEREVGALLFQRTSRGVTLTPAGALWREHAEQILHLAQIAVSDVRGLAGTRPVRVGYLHSVGAELLTRLLVGFERDNHPAVVEARSFDLSDPTAGLRDGTVDVAFTRSPVLDEDLSVLHVQSEQWAVCLPMLHPLARRETVRVEELLDEPVIAAPESAGAWREYWTAGDARGGRSAKVAAVAATFEAECLAVARGQGISFTTTEAARYSRRPGVVFVPIDGMEPARMAMAWRSAPPHVARFVAYVRAQQNESSVSEIDP